MSVLIKGMKKPDNCEICPYAFCHLDTRNCPIAEIPDHGDLIDRDELMMKMWGADAYASNQRPCNVRAVFVRDIEAAPVVIQAERRGW